jgi:hypothetical protein
VTLLQLVQATLKFHAAKILKSVPARLKKRVPFLAFAKFEQSATLSSCHRAGARAYLLAHPE